MSRWRGSGGVSSSRAQNDIDPLDKRIQENYANIIKKDVVSTPTIDFADLNALEIFDDFFNLTERIGIKSAFWCIPANHQASAALTREFLASLTILARNGVPQGIRFNLRGEQYKVPFSTLRGWFHFDTPDTMHLGYLPENEAVAQDDPVVRAQLRREF
jgi:hypothetical protein